MLFNIYVISIIISFLLFNLTLASLILRLNKIEGYRKYRNENDADFFKSISTCIIVLVLFTIPIVNIIFALMVYCKSEEAYEGTKNKIEIYNK